MKKIINFGILILMLILSSCSRDIKLENYVNKTEPFVLIINSKNKLTESKSVTLEVNSEKWKKIIAWGNKNQEGWISSPASYIGDIYITQNDFKLTHLMDSKGVVISFKDKNGNPKQYTSEIEKGELDFLYE